MKLVKYSKSTANESANNTANGTAGSRGGNTTNISTSSSVDLDRVIWGQSDTGDDVDGSMVINGDINIKCIIPPSYEDDDEDDTGDDIDEETGGGNLNVELKITAKEVQATDVMVDRHLYVKLPHPDHDVQKVCLIDAVQKNTSVIALHTTDIAKLKTDVSTNISNLTTRVQKLESKKSAGYYWSAMAQLNSGNQPVKPVEPLTYIGADIGSFQVTESKAYLWRTIDGENYSIVSYWVPPEADKYYVASTLTAGSYDENNKAYTFPVGFITFITATGTKTPFGKSAWTDTNYIYASQGGQPPVLNYPSGVFQTVAGQIPRVDGYPHIWEISNIADANDYRKWKHLQSGSSGTSNELVHVIDYSDWGNRSTSPGYAVFLIDSDYKVADKFLGQNDNDPFITGGGSSKNWENAVWRKSFLMQILSDFLYQNRHFYNSTVGWSLNWGGPISSTGYGGQWTARLGGIIAPDSDVSSNIGYYPTSCISYLMGYCYGENKDDIFRVDFRFENVRLGKKLPYSKESFQAAGTISKVGIQRFWDVSYDKCYFKYTDAGASGN